MGVELTEEEQPGPVLEPVPVPGCDVCELLAQDRDRARVKGHGLTVRSCNAVIAGHPHGRENRAAAGERTRR
ncbi:MULTISPECIES: hypothetical protein [unclassified Streptomyces]|uniref:hypothetical protein n=1 Tax=unclassified Streptomyces TaxID=2593676 RepID=UPI002DDB3B56|nr:MULTISPECIES: hypothetical protein [unclassified Streptomyces]WSA95450.1 hypothetical protein OIE63_30735 [Streptomyces sp. NBC_01795]WSB79866.1 hypothetical protein OHB04_31840 [Streptomyces sp. NBC_01775]WSS11927.1 hypothetical protein OG533_08370 [Streptomyces sp. NBC_01186]WSS40641.1 hypothetical protein OG220_08530 [Streptomyces sp. NBC_01187]